MKLLHKITADQFLRHGIAGARNSGLFPFFSSHGINPFRTVGVLSASFQSSTMAISDVITNFVPYIGATNPYMFGWGDAGHMYRINTNDSTVEDLATAASSQKGMLFYKGTVLYAQTTKIGQMTSPDAGSPTFGEPLFTGINNVTHPMHEFQGTAYIGDLNNVLTWNGTTSAVSLFSFPSDTTIVDIDDDGYYVIFATTKQTGSQKSINKIYFWDTTSLKWTKELEIYDGNLSAIHKDAKGTLLAFARNGAYAFSFGSAPQIVIPQISGLTTSDLQPPEGAVSFYKGMLAWGGNTDIFTYGNIDPRLPNIVAAPIYTGGLVKSLIFTDILNKTYYSRSGQNLLYVTDTTFGLTNSANQYLQFSSVDLGSPHQVHYIKVLLSQVLNSSNDQIIVELHNDKSASSITPIVTIDYTTSDTTRLHHKFPYNFQGQYISGLINMSDSVQFKALEIWGESLPDAEI